MERLENILTRHGYSMGLVLASAAVLLLGMILMWRSEGPALPPPKSPSAGGVMTATPEAAAARKTQQTTRQLGFLRQLLTDARRHDVELDAGFFAPFPYRISTGKWTLPAAGGRLETAELRLTTEIRKLDTPLGQLGTYQAPNIVLNVENRTDSHIAFRVVTSTSGRADCRTKGQLKQTTLALGPREALSRTECLASGRGDEITVHRVDVLLIPALSYHYLVKLKPTAVLFQARTSAGHTAPPGHTLCGGVPRQAIKQGVQAGNTSWVDVMDFYGRYTCDRHDFRIGYRRPGQDPTPSPVINSKLR